jgi:hypothetical protein
MTAWPHDDAVRVGTEHEFIVQPVLKIIIP